MLDYIIAGIALGSIYAIAASGIIVTYISSGVLNFAFGSMAYFLARLYYYLHTQQHWNAILALVASVFIAGPLLGLFLYFALFRHLRLASPLTRIVSTIGVSVAIPPLVAVIFGELAVTTAPGIATEPVHTWKFFGAVVTADQLIALIFVVAVVIIGTAVMQFTDVGLKVRAMVDTEALTSLSGVNPSRLAGGVWAVTTALAGLAGVLAAPSSGLNSQGMTLLMASAFAAVVAAQLRNLPLGVAVAMGMGILTDLLQKYLPQNSAVTANILTSVPFMVMGVFLVAYVAFSGRVAQAAATGGALDNAIRPMGGLDDASAAASTSVIANRSGWSWYMAGPVVIIGIVALLPIILEGYWLTLLSTAFAMAIILLSFTVVVGEGGMIWLCQMTFAATGAVLTAEFSNHGMNTLVAVFLGGLVAVPVGLIIGFLTIRLGDLYVALVTITFGLLAETLIFTQNTIYQEGIGLTVTRPGWMNSDVTFSYVALAIFIVLALIVVNLRRSTTGLSMAAVRYSEPGSRSIGLNVLSLKLLLGGIGAFIAGVGGGMLALNLESTSPSSFTTFGGLVLLAVFVTIGLRSITAAVLAGVSFSLLPGVFATYLSVKWGNVPTILFGLGAIAVAKNPEGQVAMNARQLQDLFVKVFPKRGVPMDDTVTLPPGDAPGGTTSTPAGLVETPSR